MSWQRPAVSVQLVLFTTRKLWLGFLTELRIDQTADVATLAYVCFFTGDQFNVKSHQWRSYNFWVPGQTFAKGPSPPLNL